MNEKIFKSFNENSDPYLSSLPEEVFAILTNKDWQHLLSKNLVGELYQTDDRSMLNQAGQSFSKLNSITKAFSEMNSLVAVIRSFNDLNGELAFNWPKLASQLQPNIKWAYRTTAWTYSKYGGSLGYHADNYNVAIIQIEGSRNWKVWDKCVLSEYEIGYMHREDPRENVKLAKIPKEDPLLDIELTPGEILWIPALFPHLGITNSNTNSVSASFVWESYSYLKLAKLIAHYKPIPIPTSLLPKFLTTPYKIIPLVTAELAAKELQFAFSAISKELNLVIDDRIISRVVERVTSTKQ